MLVVADIEVNAEVNEDGKKILTPEALAPVAAELAAMSEAIEELETEATGAGT